MSHFWQVVDLETTGLDPVNDEIAEICLLTCKNSEVIDIFHKYYSVKRMGEQASKVNNLTFEQLQGWESFKSPSNINFLFRYIKYPLFGHNIRRFDALFLKSANCLNSIIQIKDTRDFCEQSNIRLENNKLQTWLKHFNLNNSGIAHSALQDTFYLAKLIAINDWQYK